MARRRPISEIDAEAVRAVGGVGRFALGGLFLILGLLFMSAALYGGFDIGKLKKLPSSTDLLMLYFLAPLGAFIFTVGRELPTRNEVEDERLLARMSASERGQQAVRLATRYDAPLRIWVGTSALLVVVIDLTLWRLLLRLSTELWLERLLIVTITVGVIWIARRVFGRPSEIYVSRAALPATGEEKRPLGWVSKNQWVLQQSGGKRADVLEMAGLAVFLIAGGAFIQMLTSSRYSGRSYVALGLLGLVWTALEARRYWRAKVPAVLELTRECARPLVLRGRVTFGASFKPGAAAGACHVQFRASYAVAAQIAVFPAWLETAAPLEIAANGATGDFLLHVEIPESLPYFADANGWWIRVLHAGSPDPVLTFALPQDVIYLEEFPA